MSLPSSGFYRINRNSAINLDEIQSVGKVVNPHEVEVLINTPAEGYTHKVVLKGGVRLYITAKKAKKLVKFLEQW